jgi:DNA polymerase-3 subunit delta'
MARPAEFSLEEAPPEADRLEGFPHPRVTERHYGHDQAAAEFLHSFATGRPHHAWLLTGPEGIGKATLAWQIARFVLSNGQARAHGAGPLACDPDHPACRLVRQLAHPELLLIRRPWDQKAKKHKTEITIDEVRRLRSFLTLSASNGGARVVIVDPADDLNVNAANAILKSLEEPPARVVFLLISSSPGRLLPTIRSRCRTLSCTGLSGTDLRAAAIQALTARDEEIAAGVPSGPEWETLEALSNGSVRRLLMLHAAGGLDLDMRIGQQFSRLDSLDWRAIHALGDELGSSAAQQRYELFFDLLLSRVAHNVRNTATATDTPARAPLERLAAWAQLWETVLADKAETDTLNLDRKALILRTFQRLSDAAR